MLELKNLELSILFETSLGFEQCSVQLRDTLSHAGFRVVAEIPFHREFEEHLGLRWPQYSRYTVFVVWSPFPAYQSVLDDTDTGILFPFHMVIAERGERTTVAATNLSLPGQITGRIGLRLFGDNLTRQIEQILSRLHARRLAPSERWEMQKSAGDTAPGKEVS
jgi:uncharacterized protein (DUF302 family)